MTTVPPTVSLSHGPLIAIRMLANLPFMTLTTVILTVSVSQGPFLTIRFIANLHFRTLTTVILEGGSLSLLLPLCSFAHLGLGHLRVRLPLPSFAPKMGQILMQLFFSSDESRGDNANHSAIES